MAIRKPLSDILNSASRNTTARVARQVEHVSKRFESPIGKVEISLRDLQQKYKNMTPEQMEQRAEEVGHKPGEPCDCELCAMIGYIETEKARGKKPTEDAEEPQEDD